MLYYKREDGYMMCDYVYMNGSHCDAPTTGLYCGRHAVIMKKRIPARPPEVRWNPERIDAVIEEIRLRSLGLDPHNPNW